MDVKQLLEKRRRLKRKKPEFVRQDAHKKKKVGWKWRKPKGSDSKMRVGFQGYKRSVEPGWGSPNTVSGLIGKGLQPARVGSVKDLAGLDPKKSIVVIESSVGTKKKFEIVEKALAAGLEIYNFKDPKKFLEETKKSIEQKKAESKKKKEDRDKKKEATKKEAAKVKAEKEKKEKEAEAEMTEEEKKAEEKKEQDKLLISTQ